MKTLLATTTIVMAASAVMAQNFSISNPWSGVTGDRGNLAAFVFKADAGLYPNSVSPSGTILPATFSLDTVTLTRPNDATTPVFGTTGAQLTSAETPVYLDIYTSYSGGIFSGYVGSSATGVTWNQTAVQTPFTFNFSNVSISSSTKYWFVFSEDNVDGEVSNFRARLNTAGDDLTAGAGKGYLVGDTSQMIGANNLGVLSAPLDWAIDYVVAVPEPTSAALVGLGILALAFRRKA